MEESHFLAVCKDRPDDPDGFIYTVYFVNNTDEVIKNLNYLTGGFATIDDEIVQTSLFEKELGKVEPFSFVEIETDDEGSFDFVINFEFKIELQNDIVKNKNFTIGKYLRGGKKPFEPLPILNKYGYAFTYK